MENKHQPYVGKAFQPPEGFGCIVGRNQFQRGAGFRYQTGLARDAEFFGEARMDETYRLHGDGHGSVNTMNSVSEIEKIPKK